MPEPKRKIYYNSCAGEEVYDMIREVMPPGSELISLDNDDDQERFNKISDAWVAIVAATPLTRPIIEAAGIRSCISDIHSYFSNISFNRPRTSSFKGRG